MENKINIGELDTLVEVQSCIITIGTRGQKEYNYRCHGNAWAKVEMDIDENVDNHNLEQGRTLSLTMYKILGMNTRWRILLHGKKYSITSINPISRFSPLCTVGLTSIE